MALTPFGTIRWPIPRLVCVLPAPESGEAPLQESDREFGQWSAVLEDWCRGGKRKGKGRATRKLHMFFLCPHDMSLAECGPDGQGYQAGRPAKSVEHRALAPGKAFMISLLSSFRVSNIVLVGCQGLTYVAPRARCLLGRASKHLFLPWVKMSSPLCSSLCRNRVCGKTSAHL